MKTNIAVIVPSYNDWNFLLPLTQSLFREEAGCSWELVIIDDHNPPHIRAKMDEALYQYCHILRPEQKAFFTRANNVGLKWASENINPDYYFLLNSDTLVTPGWGRALMVTGAKLEAGIVGATCLYPDGRVQHLGAYGAGSHFCINEPWSRRREDKLVPWVTGAAMAISRPTFELMGYLPVKEMKQYDESDRDYCQDAGTKWGINVAVSTRCLIYHFTHQAEAQRTGRGEIHHRKQHAAF